MREKIIAAEVNASRFYARNDLLKCYMLNMYTNLSVSFHLKKYFIITSTIVLRSRLVQVNRPNQTFRR